jgi:protein SCO1/2
VGLAHEIVTDESDPEGALFHKAISNYRENAHQRKPILKTRPARRMVFGLMKPRRVRALHFVRCGLAAVLSLAFTARAAENSPAEWFGQYEPRAREAYDFQLNDPSGLPVRLSDFRGKVVLLSFGFTNCPGICPSTLAALARVSNGLPEKNRLQLVFVTLDPGRDTPERLGTFVSAFDKSIASLTGDPQTIGTVAAAYGVSFKKIPGATDSPADYGIEHSTHVYLIDPEGRLRERFRFEQLPEHERITADVARILSLSGSRP